MTLDELKREHDRYYAFSYFMTVEEAKDSEQSPKSTGITFLTNASAVVKIY